MELYRELGDRLGVSTILKELDRVPQIGVKRSSARDFFKGAQQIRVRITRV
jgi:hypothetical protein